MLHDKKMDAGTLPFLLMRGIGRTFMATDVDLDDVSAFLDEELASSSPPACGRGRGWAGSHATSP
jgi:3-dehydroquinate synthase